MAPSVRELMERILDETPGGRIAPTVDTLKAGDAAQPVRGIVTTCMATVAVLRQAITLGANLVITHEPVFYNHLDDTAALEADPIYRAKRALIEGNGLAVWRYHDHIHALQPDGIYAGVLRKLGWERYADPVLRGLCVLAPTPLNALVAYVKSRLGVPTVKIIGEPGLVCQRVGLALGAPGGARQIELLRESKLDVIVCGELNEWEVAEYVRDANALGTRCALALLGHIRSEEPGMEWLVGWLRARFPEIPVQCVPAGDPFTSM